MKPSPRPVPGTPTAWSFPHEQTSLLPNGMRLICVPMPRLPLVTLLGTVAAGSELEPARDAGLAHLGALALGEGTTYRDGDALNLAFASLGGELHTDAGWSRTDIGVTTTTPNLRETMPLLAEVMRSPAFPVRSILRLRSERLAELIQQQTEPRALADEAFAESALVRWGRHALPAEGTRQTVNELSTDKIQQWHTMHGSADPSLIVVGDVDQDTLVEVATEAFASWELRPKTSVVATVRDADADVSGVLLINKEDAPQTELRIGHASVGRLSPDYYALTVMNAVLGGLFNSRINLNLREQRGFTYGAFSGFEWRREASLFAVSTAVNRDNTADAIAEVVREIERMRQEPISEHERSLAVDYLSGVFPLRFETTGAIADAIASRNAMALDADYYSSYRDRISSITTLDVLRCAQQYLQPERLHVIAVGDAPAIRRSMDGLKLGPMSERQAIEPLDT